MREIKFRAYDTHTKIMLPIVDIIKFTKSEDIYITREGAYGVGINIQYQPHIKLMQNTGLKDKNGKEIYEGDIIQHLYENCDKSDYYKVEWDDEELRFCFRNVGNIAAYIALEDMYSDDTGEYEFKVIGNIYDNPELLEIEKEIKLDENFQF